MENKISNLIKNVLEENALKFKENTSKVLYSKVSDRLKQEYVNVSKKMFKSINEAVSTGTSNMAGGKPRLPDPEPAPTPQVPSNPSSPYPNWPTYDTTPDVRNPPNEGDYFPAGLGPNRPPNPNDYPGGADSQQYKDDYQRWKRALYAYNYHRTANERYRANRPKPKPGGSGTGPSR